MSFKLTEPFFLKWGIISKYPEMFFRWICVVGCGIVVSDYWDQISSFHVSSTSYWTNICQDVYLQKDFDWCQELLSQFWPMGDFEATLEMTAAEIISVWYLHSSQLSNFIKTFQYGCSGNCIKKIWVKC